jgi:hypothetical protein
MFNPESIDGKMRPAGRFRDPVSPAAAQDERYGPLYADPVPCDTNRGLIRSRVLIPAPTFLP